MIKIKIPNNNIPERRYIIGILFNEFLGLDFIIEVGSSDYEITLPNKKQLIIEDTFFNKYHQDLEYLKLENIPKDIYKLDIFARSFFMLTRWEEYVNKNRDSHNRFPATESLAYKQGFLDRPIVNEELEKLKKRLLELDGSLKFKKREFEFILTHDVDIAYKYGNKISMLKELVIDLVKRKSIKLFFYNLNIQIKYLLKLEKDPFDTYDYLMDLSEKVGVKSYFFLHSSSDTKQDINNDKYIKKIVDKIKKRGHFLGYHPAYNAYNHLKLFIQDKEKIEDIIEDKLTFGRAHFLRFEVPTTWQIWENAKMEWDSSLSYADREGFRCGICYPYSVFNILTRKKLNLKERPLIVMEGSFTTYQPNIKPEDMEIKIKKLIDEVKKYNGEFVFLWHNSNFNGAWGNNFGYLYNKVLNENTLSN